LRIVCSTPWADCGLWIVDCGLCPPKLSEGGFEHCGLWIVDCGLCPPKPCEGGLRIED
jgi:hypothetical protein